MTHADRDTENQKEYPQKGQTQVPSARIDRSTYQDIRQGGRGKRQEPEKKNTDTHRVIGSHEMPLNQRGRDTWTRKKHVSKN